MNNKNYLLRVKTAYGAMENTILCGDIDKSTSKIINDSYKDSTRVLSSNTTREVRTLSNFVSGRGVKSVSLLPIMNTLSTSENKTKFDFSSCIGVVATVELSQSSYELLSALKENNLPYSGNKFSVFLTIYEYALFVQDVAIDSVTMAVTDNFSISSSDAYTRDGIRFLQYTNKTSSDSIFCLQTEVNIDNSISFSWVANKNRDHEKFICLDTNVLSIADLDDALLKGYVA